MTWAEYKNSYTENGTHKVHRNWQVSGTWELTRKDGLLTAHKCQSIYPDWFTTIEKSIQAADRFVPLGARALINFQDPEYSDLFERLESE